MDATPRLTIMYVVNGFLLVVLNRKAIGVTNVRVTKSSNDVGLTCYFSVLFPEELLRVDPINRRLILFRLRDGSVMYRS